MLEELAQAAANVGMLLAGAGAVGAVGMRLRRRLSGSRWRVVIDAAVVAAAAVAVAGTAVELAALVYDPPVRMMPGRFFEYRPGLFATEPNQRWVVPPLPRWPGYEIRTNEDGLRIDRPRLPPPSSPDERRVMFLGDSFTFGIGLEVEQGYPAQAEQLLRSAAPQYQWIALNAGVGGTNIFTAVEWFAWLAPLYRPQIAVFTVAEADDVLPDVNTQLRRRGQGGPSVLGRFALYRMGLKLLQTVRYVEARERGRRIEAGELPAERAQLLAEIDASAALMAETARRVGCAVIVNRIRQYSRNQSSPPMQHSLLQPYVDAGATMVDTDWDIDDASLKIPDEGHPTPAGALLMARAAVPAILAAAERAPPAADARQ